MGRAEMVRRVGGLSPRMAITAALLPTARPLETLRTQLSGAGLLFSSFVRMRTADLGFEPDGLIALMGLKIRVCERQHRQKAATLAGSEPTSNSMACQGF